jgi:biotin carboxyl carrier protein
MGRMERMERMERMGSTDGTDLTDFCREKTTMVKRFTLTFEGRPYQVEVDEGKVTVEGKAFPVAREGISVQVGGRPYTVQIDGDQASVDGITYPVAVAGVAGRPAGASKPAARKRAAKAAAAQDPGQVAAIMPGKILRVEVAEGDAVEEGDVLVILEAMKMENELRAKRSGVVRQVTVSAGDDVEMGELLVVVG